MAERYAGIGNRDLRLRGVLGKVRAPARCLAQFQALLVPILPIAEERLDLVLEIAPLNVAGHRHDHVFGAEEPFIMLANLGGGQALEPLDGAAAVLTKR